MGRGFDRLDHSFDSFDSPLFQKLHLKHLLFFKIRVISPTPGGHSQISSCFLASEVVPISEIITNKRAK